MTPVAVAVAEAAAAVAEAVARLPNSPTNCSAPVAVAMADLEALVVQVQAPNLLHTSGAGDRFPVVAS